MNPHPNSNHFIFIFGKMIKLIYSTSQPTDLNPISTDHKVRCASKLLLTSFIIMQDKTNVDKGLRWGLKCCNLECLIKELRSASDENTILRRHTYI